MELTIGPSRKDPQLALWLGQPAVNQLDHSCDHFIDRHARCVYLDRVPGGSERRHRARRIAPVPLRYVKRKARKVSTDSLFFQLLMTAPGTFLGARCEEHLDSRIGEDNGAHIASVGHQARRRTETFLQINQSLTNLTILRHLRG